MACDNFTQIKSAYNGVLVLSSTLWEPLQLIYNWHLHCYHMNRYDGCLEQSASGPGLETRL